VGLTRAYSLLLRRITVQILPVDTHTSRLQAPVEDLSNAAFLSSTRVRSATAKEAVKCNITIITTCGTQLEGESRRDPIKNDAVLLLVSKPVDVLTYFAQMLSGLPKGLVVGAGTFLDSVRSRSALAGEVQVSG
jgi:L-lactate dehydrogenase